MTMDFDQLKALKRPQIQKLARREGMKANGKNVDMIKQLLAKFPGGVPRLEEPEPEVENSRVRAAIGGDALDSPLATREPSTGLAGPVLSQQQQDVPPTELVGPQNRPDQRSNSPLQNPSPSRQSGTTPAQRTSRNDPPSLPIHIIRPSTSPEPRPPSHPPQLPIPTDIDGHLATAPPNPPQDKSKQPLSDKVLKVKLGQMAQLVKSRPNLLHKLDEMKTLVEIVDQQLRETKLQLSEVQHKRYVVENEISRCLKTMEESDKGSHKWKSSLGAPEAGNELPILGEANEGRGGSEGGHGDASVVVGIGEEEQREDFDVEMGAEGVHSEHPVSLEGAESRREHPVDLAMANRELHGEHSEEAEREGRESPIAAEEKHEAVLQEFGGQAGYGDVRTDEEKEREPPVVEPGKEDSPEERLVDFGEKENGDLRQGLGADEELSEPLVIEPGKGDKREKHLAELVEEYDGSSCDEAGKKEKQEGQVSSKGGFEKEGHEEPLAEISKDEHEDPRVEPSAYEGEEQTEPAVIEVVEEEEQEDPLAEFDAEFEAEEETEPPILELGGDDELEHPVGLDGDGADLADPVVYDWERYVPLKRTRADRSSDSEGTQRPQKRAKLWR